MKKSGMFVYLLASERSERDNYRGKNEKIGNVYWRASVASETLTGVTQFENRGCLFIYIYGHMYVILYFDPPYFCVRSAFDPVPNCTKQNPLVYRSLPVITLEIELCLHFDFFCGCS